MTTNDRARRAYDSAVDDLKKFCEYNTELTTIIMDETYPIRVQFIPDLQYNLFQNPEENIDENGEINDMTVTVGLETSVKSTLKFKMDARLLKKLIRLAERVGAIYYHAFREGADELKEMEEPIDG